MSESCWPSCDKPQHLLNQLIDSDVEVSISALLTNHLLNPKNLSKSDHGTPEPCAVVLLLRKIIKTRPGCLP